MKRITGLVVVVVVRLVNVEVIVQSGEVRHSCDSTTQMVREPGSSSTNEKGREGRPDQRDGITGSPDTDGIVFYVELVVFLLFHPSGGDRSVNLSLILEQRRLLPTESLWKTPNT